MAQAPWYRWHGDSLELRIHAKTRCRDEGLGAVTAGAVPVRVSAPPTEGEANRRLVTVLADAFGVAKSRVRLVNGSRSRHKWIRIERPGIIPEPLRSALRDHSRLTKSEKTTKN